MTKQMAIGKKLLASVGAMSLMLIAMLASALYGIGSLQNELTTAVTTTGKKLDMAGEMAASVNELRIHERGMIVYSAIHETAQVASEATLFEQRASAFRQLIEEVKPLLTTEHGRTLIGTMEQNLPTYLQAERQIEELCVAGKTADAMAIRRDRAAPAVAAIGKAIGELKQVQRDLFQQALSDSSNQASVARWITWSLALLSLLTAAIVIRVVLGLSRKLRSAASALDEGVEQIASAAGQVASSSLTLAEGASQQAASLEETSASTEEITSMTRSNATHSQAAARLMLTVHEQVADGNKALDAMVSSMDEINTSSGKIAKIIRVIDEIAFQTNILALNAAVEAARAGQAGLGFAVVADEVRTLAHRSAQASKDTADLIEESIDSSRAGKARLEKVAGVVHSITESASQVKALVEEVSTASQEQARGIEQIGKAVTHMDRVTQGTAATAEEGASAAEELSAQAQTMSLAVHELRVLVDGGAR